MFDQVSNKKITELINENYVYAYVLYYFGIEFYEHQEKTLQQVCQERDIDIKKLLKNFENIDQPGNDMLMLEKYPVELVIEYLKHAHHLFIKQKLPYLAHLIKNLPAQLEQHFLVRELKFAFPLFVQDFIEHIYEEEDTIFAHVLYLKHALVKGFDVTDLYYKMEEFSIEDQALEHAAHDDDEMKGIRELTCGYNIFADNIHLKVVMEELKSFDSEMRKHAKIENEIFFPKALMLEAELKHQIEKKIRKN